MDRRRLGTPHNPRSASAPAARAKVGAVAAIVLLEITCCCDNL